MNQKTHLENDIWVSGNDSIERNFSGLELDVNNKKSSVDVVKEIYINNMPNHIKENFH